jgi:ATP-dependent DNA helicase RecQ
VKYIGTNDCRMEFLQRSLDDSTARRCGRCDNCVGPFLSTAVSGEALQALQRHVDRVGIDISPRSLWPTGLPAIGVNLSGRIVADEVALPGRAIARLADIGWGEEIRALLDHAGVDTSVPAPILNRAVAALGGEGEARLAAVVVINSRTRSTIVRSLAEHLAAKLNLPFLGMLETSADSRRGSGKANNARRVAALHDAFTVPSAVAAACADLQGQILLVDDFVDSGWTMTLAARALRRCRAAAVVPFALATTGRRD